MKSSESEQKRKENKTKQKEPTEPINKRNNVPLLNESDMSDMIFLIFCPNTSVCNSAVHEESMHRW